MEGLGELPELRHQHGAEEGALAELLEELEGRDDAVEDEGRAAVVAIDLERGLGADGVGEIEVLALDAEEEVELELVGAGDALRAAEAGDSGGVGEGARGDGENVSHRARVRRVRRGREWRRSVGAEANTRQSVLPRWGEAEVASRGVSASVRRALSWWKAARDWRRISARERTRR